MDERADESQRGALEVIVGGGGGGWPGEFAAMIGEMRGIEYVPITFEIADDLAYWAAEVPGKATARAEALTGLTAGLRCSSGCGSTTATSSAAGALQWHPHPDHGHPVCKKHHPDGHRGSA